MNEYRGYKFRIYPTEEQELQLGKIFSAVHFTYNELMKAWLKDQNLELCSALDQLIRQNPWLEFIDRSILNHTRINLENACSAFLREHGAPSAGMKDPGSQNLPANAAAVRQSAAGRQNREDDFQSGSANAAASRASGKSCESRSGRRSIPHPRFKTKKDSYSSFTISSSNNINIRYNMLTLGGQRGLSPIRIVQSRPLPRGAHICSATVSRNPSGEYYVSILCRSCRNREPASTGTSIVGLDYSLPSFFVASDPTLIPDENCLHHWKRSREKLANASRKLSRMVPHSRNYEKQKIRIARIHEEIRCQRRDYLQKLSTEIADRYDIVCVETLDLIEMEGHAHNFARSIQDNGWAEFVRMLSYKLRDRGKTLVKVSRWFPSSRLCHECGYLYRGLTLSEREWDCPSCGTHINRDYNASLNIRDEGLRIILQHRQGAGRADGTRRSIARMEYNSRFAYDSRAGSILREYNPQDPAVMPMLDYLYEDTGSFGGFGARGQTYWDDSWENDEIPGISSWDKPLYISAEKDARDTPLRSSAEEDARDTQFRVSAEEDPADLLRSGG